MSRYRLIGILVCPYTQKCGPDKQWPDSPDDEFEAERVCFTRRHRDCPEYKSRIEKQRQLNEAVTI